MNDIPKNMHNYVGFRRNFIEFSSFLFIIAQSETSDFILKLSDKQHPLLLLYPSYTVRIPDPSNL